MQNAAWGFGLVVIGSLIASGCSGGDVAPASCDPITAAGFRVIRADGSALDVSGEESPGTTAAAIAALEGGELLGIRGADLVHSRDEGCSWRVLTSGVAGPRAVLAPAPDGSVYVLTTVFDGSTPLLLQVDLATDTVSTRPAPPWDGAAAALVAAPDGTLRAIDEHCAVFDSSDQGRTWAERAAGPREAGSSAVAGIDADHLDHVVCGTSAPLVTFDGGATWSRSAIATEPAGLAWTSFAVRLVGTDAWLDFQGSSSEQILRTLQRSVDGGRSFVAVASAPDFSPPRGSPLVVEGDEVYFLGATTVRRLDARMGALDELVIPGAFTRRCRNNCLDDLGPATLAVRAGTVYVGLSHRSHCEPYLDCLPSRP